MITPEGYSKDPCIRPEGIVVTWGKDMIKEKGGLLSFIRYFESAMGDEEQIWMHKSKNRPSHEDLLYVYIIVCNQVRYRLYYAGYEHGEREMYNADDSVTVISWPRILLAGPYVKAPYKIRRSGFQGFRYCTKLF